MAKTVSDLDTFVKKSSFRMKRISEHKASLQGEFVYKTANLEVSGQLDLRTGRLDSLEQRLVLGGTPIFELSRSTSIRMSRAEYKFGKDTEGVRSLVLNYERVGKRSVATGYADGKELLPYFTKGGHCSCSEPKDAPQRPLLAWGADSSTHPVTIQLSKKLQPELEGLATVTTEVMDRISEGGGLGDWGSDIDWVICFLECIGGFIWCIIKAIFLPKSEIFITLCFVTNGNCYDWCTITTQPWP